MYLAILCLWNRRAWLILVHPTATVLFLLANLSCKRIIMQLCSMHVAFSACLRDSILATHCQWTWLCDWLWLTKQRGSGSFWYWAEALRTTATSCQLPLALSCQENAPEQVVTAPVACIAEHSRHLEHGWFSVTPHGDRRHIFVIGCHLSTLGISPSTAQPSESWWVCSSAWKDSPQP